MYDVPLYQKKGLIINLNHAIRLSGKKIIFVEAMQRWHAFAGFGDSDDIKYIEEYPSELEAQTVFYKLTQSLPPKDEGQ